MIVDDSLSFELASDVVINGKEFQARSYWTRGTRQLFRYSYARKYRQLRMLLPGVTPEDVFRKSIVSNGFRKFVV